MFRIFPADSQIPFMSYRYGAGVLSLIFVLLSCWFLWSKGLNYGVDFAGGVQMVLSFDREAEADAESLRAAMSELGLEASVQTFGTTLDRLAETDAQAEKTEFIVHFSGEFLDEEILRGKIENVLSAQLGGEPETWFRRFRVAGMEKVYFTLARDAELSALRESIQSLDLSPLEVVDVAALGTAEAREFQIQLNDPSSRILNHLNQVFSERSGVENPVELAKLDFVGAKVGSDLKIDAFLSVIVTIFLIFLYIYYKFDLVFSPGVVVALAHDVLITVGFFALLGMEFDLTTVAALLTVAGYSINDTIIVYDRIREARAEYRGKSLSAIMDIAINQTLSRTVITSLTTLMASAVLFFVGGPVIHSFAFALTVGVLVGTYSSIFVAAPLVLACDRFFGKAPSRAAKEAA